MPKEKNVFSGTGKPVTDEAVAKLKKDIELSEAQTRQDSKVEEKLLKSKFNS